MIRVANNLFENEWSNSKSMATDSHGRLPVALLVFIGFASAVHAAGVKSRKPREADSAIWLQCAGALKYSSSSNTSVETTVDREDRFPPLVVDGKKRKLGLYDDKHRSIYWLDGHAVTRNSAPDGPHLSGSLFYGHFNRAEFANTEISIDCEDDITCSDAGLQGGHQSNAIKIDRRSLRYSTEIHNMIGPRPDGFFWGHDVTATGSCTPITAPALGEDPANKI